MYLGIRTTTPTVQFIQKYKHKYIYIPVYILANPALRAGDSPPTYPTQIPNHPPTTRPTHPTQKRCIKMLHKNVTNERTVNPYITVL